MKPIRPFPMPSPSVRPASIGRVVRLGVAALLLGVSAVASSTDISLLPLRVTALPKPMVVLALDNSGSMDMEVLLPTNDGALWWNGVTGRGWDASGRLYFNDDGEPTADAIKAIYLVANGIDREVVNGEVNPDVIAAPGRRVNIERRFMHTVLPPTAEFAFLRSPQYNPIYYDPTVSYQPWAPAVVNGARVTFGPANPRAARMHPLYAATAVDLTVSLPANRAVGYTYGGEGGMEVPAGTEYCKEPCSTWVTTSVNRRIPNSERWRLAMPNFVPTYYLREACGVNGTTCVSAPDGATLRRYRIERSAYGSTAQYNAAIANFANWFQYHRTRKLMADAAMGRVLSSLEGVRVAETRFNFPDDDRPALQPVDIATPSDREGLIGRVYQATPGGGTPTRETMAWVDQQFERDTRLVTSACQRNATLIVTDGFSFADPVPVPGYDRSQWGATAPYAHTHDGTLADLALSQYTRRLRPDLPRGRVPPLRNDANRDLHVNTYALSLGARGLVYRDESTPKPTSPNAWVPPPANRHPGSIDDLWHATINGRGAMYLADTPNETADRISAAFSEILRGRGSQASIGLLTPNLQRGDRRAYSVEYDPGDWSGDLVAHPIRPSDGEVDTTRELWSLAAKLDARDWRTRRLFSHDGARGQPITATSVGARLLPSGSVADRTRLVDYLRGDRTFERTVFRARGSRVGAFIRGEPAVHASEEVMFTASADGLVRAVDLRAPNDGEELWAYLPGVVAPRVAAASAAAAPFAPLLDGTPTLATLRDGRRLLVGGLGLAGAGYYALDVSQPRQTDDAVRSAAVRWEFPTTAGVPWAHVGRSAGRPVVLRSRLWNDDVVVLTSGYGVPDQGGRLWVVRASTGALLRTIPFNSDGTGQEIGLTHVAAFRENDGTARHVYAGDLQGRLWHIDLDNPSPSPRLVARLTGPGDVAQPVTAPPDLALHNGRRVVVVGTGRLLGRSDIGSTDVRSLYVIVDPGTGATLDPRRTFPRVEIDPSTGRARSSSTPAPSLDGGGWYVDLPAGDQIDTRPAIGLGAVAVVANRFEAGACAGRSSLLVLDLQSGGQAYGVTSNKAYMLISDSGTSSGVRIVVDSSGKARALVRDDTNKMAGGGSAWEVRRPDASRLGWRDLRIVR